MKTKIYAAAALGLGLLMFGNTAKAQIQDEQNVTVTLDMQPVLQLFMTTSNQVNFTFNTIESYMGGEIQYGATILKVSSSVNWDLYAVGTSTGGIYWDNQIIYGALGANASTNIPLDVLELHQYPNNNTNGSFVTAGGSCTTGDYSLPFAPVATAAANAGQNNIFATSFGSLSPYTSPGINDKYIAGGFGTSTGAPGTQNIGGSYLTASSIVANSPGTSNYYYVIDYRILPGLPVVFPTDATDQCTADINAIGLGGNAGKTYYQPGVYTMDVKYVLLQDQ